MAGRSHVDAASRAHAPAAEEAPAPGLPSQFHRTWPGAGRSALGRAASGFADYVRRALGNPEVPSLVGQNMTRCLDGRAYKGYAEYMKLRQESEELSPNFAGQRAWWPLGCVGWPVLASNPMEPLSARGLVPFLGVGSWTDHDNVASIIRHVPGSSSVKYEGHGHMMYIYGNTGCVTAHVNRWGCVAFRSVVTFQHQRTVTPARAQAQWFPSVRTTASATSPPRRRVRHRGAARRCRAPSA
jgi:hypothetical protein